MRSLWNYKDYNYLEEGYQALPRGLSLGLGWGLKTWLYLWMSGFDIQFLILSVSV